MAGRVGPDESVNDPRVLQSLLGKARYLVDVYSAFKEASDAEDFDLTGITSPGTTSMTATPVSRLIDNVYFPLRLATGESETYGSAYAAGITQSTAFNNNAYVFAPNDPLRRSTIKTYENLAEFFRTGWGQINQFPPLLSDYSATGNEQVVDSAGTISSSCSVAGNGIKSESELVRLVDSTSFDTKEVSFLYLLGGSFVPKTTPEWVGVGPTSYFDTTYPQLRDEYNTLFPTVSITETTDQTTDHKISVLKRTSGIPAPTGTGEAKELYLQSSFSISVYNPSTTDSRSITASVNNSCTHGNLIFAPGTGRGCELFCQARISILDFDGMTVSTTDNSSTVVVEAPNAIDTSSGSNSESTTESIPPLGRAIIRVQSRVRQQTPSIGVSQPFGSGAASITVDGNSISRSASFGFFGSGC